MPSLQSSSSRRDMNKRIPFAWYWKGKSLRSASSSSGRMIQQIQIHPSIPQRTRTSPAPSPIPPRSPVSSSVVSVLPGGPVDDLSAETSSSSTYTDCSRCNIHRGSGSSYRSSSPSSYSRASSAQQPESESSWSKHGHHGNLSRSNEGARNDRRLHSPTATVETSGLSWRSSSSGSSQRHPFSSPKRVPNQRGNGSGFIASGHHHHNRPVHVELNMSVRSSFVSPSQRRSYSSPEHIPHQSGHGSGFLPSDHRYNHPVLADMNTRSTVSSPSKRRPQSPDHVPHQPGYGGHHFHHNPAHGTSSKMSTRLSRTNSSRTHSSKNSVHIPHQSNPHNHHFYNQFTNTEPPSPKSAYISSVSEPTSNATTNGQQNPPSKHPRTRHIDKPSTLRSPLVPQTISQSLPIPSAPAPFTKHHPHEADIQQPSKPTPKRPGPLHSKMMGIPSPFPGSYPVSDTSTDYSGSGSDAGSGSGSYSSLFLSSSYPSSRLRSSYSSSSRPSSWSTGSGSGSGSGDYSSELGSFESWSWSSGFGEGRSISDFITAEMGSLGSDGDGEVYSDAVAYQ